MMLDLAAAFDLGPRELVAFTGGGGKTTLMMALSEQLAGRGDRVITTTTTKLGLDQTEGRTVCWSGDQAAVDDALAEARWVMVLSEADDHKVLGYSPDTVDSWFRDGGVDYVLVEADGARRRPLKAPAGHEPVIPRQASLVVVVTGIDAVGRTIGDVVHRPERATELTGLPISAPVTPEVVVTILTHPEGGLQGVPPAARVIVAITKVAPASDWAAESVREGLLRAQGIDFVVVVPHTRG